MQQYSRRLRYQQVPEPPTTKEGLREVLMEELQTPTTEDEEIAELLGSEISEVALFAAQILRRTGAYSVLCPGCGRGHCSAFFARRGFQVTAYDSSEGTIVRATATAERVGVKIDAFVDDVIIPHRRLRQFDALFSHNILHQMRAQQRRSLVRNYYNALRQGGVLIVSVLSSEDDRYGYGRQIEENTFETPFGGCLHFYNSDDLHEELDRYFDVARVEEMREVEATCGMGKQVYRLLVATALKVDR